MEQYLYMDKLEVEKRIVYNVSSFIHLHLIYRFTMMGPNDDLTGFCDDQKLKGLIPRIVESVFDSVDSADSEIEFTIQVSYIEIYLEKIRDLLDPTQQNLIIKEDRDSGRGIYVKGATEEYVTSAEEVFLLMKEGASNRAVSATRMNEESSRSHSIFIFTISQKHTVSLESKTGKLFLVDLAGSEKVKKTGAQGKLLEEAKNINKSLSCLGNVINALTDGKSRYIPYRDSKLTRMLQDSLGGNSRTTLIINCSPSTYNDFETLSTLRFGIRAKSIKNKPKVNRELSVKELTMLLEKAKSEINSQKKYIQDLEIEIKKLNGGKLSADLLKQSKHLASIQSDNTQGGIDDYEPEIQFSDSPQKIASSPSSNNVSNNSVSDELLQEIQHKLQAEIDKCNRLTEEREKLKQRYNEMRDELEGKVEYYREVERDLNSYMNDLRTMNSLKTNEVAELKMSLEKLEYESTEKDFTIENLEIRNESLTKEMNTLKIQISDLKLKEIESKEVSKVGTEIKDVDEFVEFITDTNMELLSNGDASFSQSSLFSAEKKKQRLNKILTQLKTQLRDLKKAGDDDWEEETEDSTTTTTNVSVGTEPLAASEPVVVATEEKSIEQSVEQSEPVKKPDVEKVNTLTVSTKVRSTEPKSTATPQTPTSVFSRLFTTTDKHTQNQTMETLRKELENAHKRMQQEREAYEKQMFSLMNDLTNRCDKVVELEMCLDEARDKYNQLIDNSAMKKNLDKIAFLQRSLQATTAQLQEMTQQKNNKELQLKLMENKLKIRDDRILNLDQNVKEIINKTNMQTNKYIEKLAEQNKTISNQKADIEKLNSVIRRLQDENEIKDEDTTDEVSQEFESDPTVTPPPLHRSNSRIVKPLRGGGGKKAREKSPPHPRRNSQLNSTPRRNSQLNASPIIPSQSSNSSANNSSFDSLNSSLGKIISPEDYFERSSVTPSPDFYAPKKTPQATPKRFSIRDFFFAGNNKKEQDENNTSDLPKSATKKRNPSIRETKLLGLRGAFEDVQQEDYFIES
jgi:kinesin family protein 5